MNDRDKNSEFILTLETAVRGGSVSLFRENQILDFQIGDKSVSSSEDLIPKISELLGKNDILKTDIKSIIISNGPGSFTGIRIGIATALALQKSLKCDCFGGDILKSIARKVIITSGERNIISAVSQGRNKICWYHFRDIQISRNVNEAEYNVSDLDFLIEYVKNKLTNKNETEIITICADSSIYNQLESCKGIDFSNDIKLINAGENLSASLIFGFFDENYLHEKPHPLYLEAK